MTETLRYEKIGSDSYFGNILNTFFGTKVRHGYVRVRGTVLPEYFHKFGDQIPCMDVRDDDVFVCSYPKTGTTWTQEMVWCIANDLDYEGAKTQLYKRFPFLECFCYNNFEGMYKEHPDFSVPTYVYDSVNYTNEFKTRRFIMSHLPLGFLPKKLSNFSTRAKIIYVCRNPKDTCVSYYHHCQLLAGYTGDFDMFSELFMNDMLPFSPYWEHILPFWALRNNHNVLFLRYEDMKKDLPSVIRKTADFLGKSLTEKQIASLVDHLSFESMKKNPALNKEWMLECFRKYKITTREGCFLRSGQVGGWMKEMKPEISDKFDLWTEEKTAGTDFQFSNQCRLWTCDTCSETLKIRWPMYEEKRTI